MNGNFSKCNIKDGIYPWNGEYAKSRFWASDGFGANATYVAYLADFLLNIQIIRFPIKPNSFVAKHGICARCGMGHGIQLKIDYPQTIKKIMSGLITLFYFIPNLLKEQESNLYF